MCSPQCIVLMLYNLQDALPNAVPLTLLPSHILLYAVGEGEATAGLGMSGVTTDVGVSLGVSPHQARLSVLRYERLQGDPGQFSLFSEGVVTQPALLRSSCQGGVAIPSHDVPGLQELDCKNNIYYQD